jgi:hypothetical protein
MGKHLNTNQASGPLLGFRRPCAKIDFSGPLLPNLGKYVFYLVVTFSIMQLQLCCPSLPIYTDQKILFFPIWRPSYNRRPCFAEHLEHVIVTALPGLVLVTSLPHTQRNAAMLQAKN